VHLMRFGFPVVFALALAAGSASSAAAQSTVTSSDVQRLQDSIYDASRAVGQLRSRDGNAASQLQAELDDAADEAIYLKVKLRKNEPVGRYEYTDVRDRVENIRNRARGDAAGGYTPPATYDDRPVSSAGNPGRAPYPNDGRSPNDTRYPNDGRAPYPNDNTIRSQNPNEIPVGAEFDVRLQNPLSSKTAQVEERFEATTMVDLRDERGKVMVPAGSVMRGVVSSVHPATRMDRKGSLTVAFDRVTVNGRSYPIRATVSQALESEGIMGEKEKIGIGAGAGAILGAILGGAKGALAGILIGGGGTIAATEGKDVDLPAGTVLRVRLDSGLNLR
jgi:TolA-binding protein